MSEPVYTASNGTTVTDVTDQWESEGKITCILHIEFADVEFFCVSGVNGADEPSAWDKCYVTRGGNLCTINGVVLATPKPKPKKYRPFADDNEFLKLTEGRPVWLRYDDNTLKQLVTQVDEDEVLTASWTWKYSHRDDFHNSRQMSLTPHIADSWVPFGVEEA